MDTGKISKRIVGKRVSHLEAHGDDAVGIVFSDGLALVVRRAGQGLAVDLGSREGWRDCPAALQPTSRQQQYLDFIEKYMLRFGISPAESDIQRHFLVSAPSVNAMVQTLERHGFIVRQQGVPRSIRMVEATACASCGGTHRVRVTPPAPAASPA